MPVLVPIGTSDTPSTEFTVTTGTEVFLFLVNEAGGNITPFARADIQLKSSDGQWFNQVALTGANPGSYLGAGGPYRVVRRRCDSAFGVEKA